MATKLRAVSTLPSILSLVVFFSVSVNVMSFSHYTAGYTKAICFCCFFFIYFIHLASDCLGRQCYSTSPHHSINPIHPTSPPPTPQATHILISWPNEAGALSVKVNQWESASMLSLFFHFSHLQSRGSYLLFIYVFYINSLFFLGFSCVPACVPYGSLCDAGMSAHADSHGKSLVRRVFLLVDKKSFICRILLPVAIKGIRLPHERKSHHRLHLH